MKKKPMKRLAALFLAMVVSVSSVLTASPAQVQAAPKPTKITLAAKKATVGVGGTTTIKVKTVAPKKASKKASSFTYKTSNKKVATVSSKGVVKGKKVGTAKITVTSKTNKKVKATFKVTVKKALKSIAVKNVSKKKLTLEAGKKFTLKMKIAPSKAYSNGFTYKTSNKKVATVSSKGVIKAVAAGKAKITITSKANKKVKTTVTVTVKAAPSQPSTQQPSTQQPSTQQPSTQQPSTQQPGTPDQPSKVEVTAVSLSKTEATLYANKTLELTATVEPANATDKTVTWKTDKTSVVTLVPDEKDSSKVVVKPLSEGKATVTATAGGKTASCVVTVVTQENALSGNKYSLLKDAEKYTITRGTSTFAFTQEEIEADLAKIAEETNKTWTNETVFDYIAKATTETLSGKLGLFQRILKEVPDASVEATAGKVTDNSIDVQDSMNCAGWWEQWSKDIPVNEKGTKVTFHTVTKSDAPGNWDTPLVRVLVDGAEVYIARSDNYAFGYEWTYITEQGQYDWDTFLERNKKGVEGGVEASLEDGAVVLKITNDGVSSVHKYPVDTSKSVVIEIGGEQCDITNIKAEPIVQEKYISEKNVTVTKDGKVKKCTVSGKLGEDGISLDITAEDGRTVNITELNVEEKDDTHVLTFNVIKSGSKYQFKLVIAKNAKNVALYRVVNNKDEVVASFVDGDASYDLEFNETYYNEFIEKYGVEDVVKTVKVMNDYQPVK